MTIDVSKLLTKVDKSTRNRTKEYLMLLEFAKASILINEGNVANGLKILRKASDIIFDEMLSTYKTQKAYRTNHVSVLKQTPRQKPIDILNTDFPTSIFIFGPSRSGKSVLEKLLSSFQSVERGYESNIVKNASRRTSAKEGLPGRDYLSELPPQTEKSFRKYYLEELSERVGEKSFFTITTPGIIFDACRLAQSIPNTRFIFVKRDMEDIVYRTYMYLYKSENSQSYNIDAIREYVNWYYEVQDKLSELLPDITMTVEYDDMVKNPLAIIKAVKNFCNIKENVGRLPDIGDDRGFARKFEDL